MLPLFCAQLKGLQHHNRTRGFTTDVQILLFLPPRAALSDRVGLLCRAARVGQLIAHLHFLNGLFRQS